MIRVIRCIGATVDENDRLFVSEQLFANNGDVNTCCELVLIDQCEVASCLLQDRTRGQCRSRHDRRGHAKSFVICPLKLTSNKPKIIHFGGEFSEPSAPRRRWLVHDALDLDRSVDEVDVLDPIAD